MEKYYIINQPPLAEKYIFLVDDKSEKVNYGLTTDIDKINYNRKILGENFNIEIKVGLLMAESPGTTAVFQLGNFITVLELRKDQKAGKMAFFDCIIDMPRNELNDMLVKAYSQNIANEWFKHYDYLNANFSLENDIIELYKPDF
nr:hypothetical protein [uncultured Flavobacterium sp.]